MIDPSWITPRHWLIISVLLIVAFGLWHEFILKPTRLVDQLCERVGVLEIDKTDEDVRTVLREMTHICGDRQPIPE